MSAMVPRRARNAVSLRYAEKRPRIILPIRTRGAVQWKNPPATRRQVLMPGVGVYRSARPVIECMKRI